MRISLIMPVYNAEATLPRALQSIASQTFHDFEVVVVDDGSTDRTSELLQAFSEENDISCKIICQENKGVAAARNRGLDAAEGAYLGFIDADDTLEPDALAKAVTAMEGSGQPVDIVGWDWTLGFEKNGRTMRQADYDTPLQALKNLMGGTMRWNLWLFLIRRELQIQNGIRFIDGANMGEDMLFIIKAFCAAKNVVHCHEALYRYNAVSDSSLSRQFSEVRRREIETNLKEVVTAIQASPYAEVLAPRINDLKLFLKRPLLVNDDRNNYELWYRWFPEANAYATANKALPLHTRFLQGLAARQRWGGVALYYRLVHQFIYGIVYR